MIRPKPCSGDLVAEPGRATALTVEVLGARWLVRAQDETVGRRLEHLYAPFVIPAAPVSFRRRFSLVGSVDAVTVYRGCRPMGEPESVSSAIERLAGLLNEACLSDCRAVAVHAGAVRIGQVAVAVPGPSGAGKSTLVAALVRSGQGYLTDEALCLDRSGSVIPYPKPLSIDVDGAGRAGLPPGTTNGEGQPLLAPSQLGAFVAPEARVPLGHVVLMRRRPGPATVEPRPAVVGHHALLHHSFNHYRDRERAFTVTARAACGARTWELGYEDPVDAAARLEQLVRAHEARRGTR